MARPPEGVDLHPANRGWKSPALEVACPWCRAAAGEACTRWAPRGRVPTRAPHPSRVNRLADRDAGLPDAVEREDAGDDSRPPASPVAGARQGASPASSSPAGRDVGDTSDPSDNVPNGSADHDGKQE